MLVSRINCGNCSIVINVICVKGFDLFNIDTISRNPPSTPTSTNASQTRMMMMVIGYWKQMANDIIYLDLCTHPFYVNVSDVRVRVGQEVRVIL